MPRSRDPLQEVSTEDTTLQNQVQQATGVSRRIKDCDPAGGTSQVTPTKVLRSGRRVAPTPTTTARKMKPAARVPVEQHSESTRKPARRVPVEQENAAKLGSSRGIREGDEERGPDQTRVPVKSPKGAPTASRGRKQATATPVYRPGPAAKLENSPVSGLIEDAGCIRLSGSPDATHSIPKGLLTDIQQVQQAVRDEQNLCDLRAEIMKVQEDVLRELDSAESSPSFTAGDKAQAGTLEVPEEGNLGNPRSMPSGNCLSPPVSFPGTKAPQNTPAFNTLPSSSGHGSLLRSNATASSSSAYSTLPEASQTQMINTDSSFSADITMRLAALQVPVGLESDDSDASDLADKLDALRTKSPVEDKDTAGPFRGHRDATIDEEGSDEENVEEEYGIAEFIPRATAGPSFMERKLAALQDSEWSTPYEPKVHKSGIERAKEEAEAAKRNSGLSSTEKALTRKLVQHAIGNAVRCEGKGLGESLVKHKSRLEREKEKAALNAPSAPSTKMAKHTNTNIWDSQDLSDVMTKHKSRLQKEKDAAEAAHSADGRSPSVPSYMRSTAASRHAQASSAPGLGEAMIVHKSRLERERDIAREAARGKSPRRPNEAARKVATMTGAGGLGDMKVHKGRLEREKEEAVRKATEAQPAEKRPTAAARSAQVWSSGSLGDMKPHKSRIEREKAAWAKAGSRQAAPRLTQAATPRGAMRVATAFAESRENEDTSNVSPSYARATQASVARRSADGTIEFEAL